LFFRRCGSFRTRLSPAHPWRPPIPRFRCKACGRSFSARTFSVEFRLHKPEHTDWALELFASCVSMRQAGRLGGRLSRGSIARRMVRFGLHCQRLLRRTRRDCLAGRLLSEFQLDEAESFEAHRVLAPLTVPVLLERETRLVLSTSVGTLPARVPRKSARFRRLPAEIRARSNRSSVVVGRCLAALLRVAAPGSLLVTDRKPAYRALLRRLDPRGTIAHGTVSSKAPRTQRNPLFPVNHTLAMMRDGLSRLRRRTWCHAKKRLRLWCHLGIYFAWKNFVRVRFNAEALTPAQRAGVTKGRWRVADLVRWRLDLGPVSPSPWA
jgi:transposase-like protein